jgi:hypothetical protein
MIREMVYRLNDDDASVLKANHAAWVALTKCVPAEELVQNVEFLKNLLASMVSDARRRKGGVGDGEFLLPGFNMAQGMSPLNLICFRENMMKRQVRPYLWGIFHD